MALSGYKAIKFSKNGLTLVELLVVMSILSILITLILSVLFDVQKAQEQINKKYEVHTEADRVLKEIRSYLQKAQKLISGTNQQLKFVDIDYDTIEFHLRDDTIYKNSKPLAYFTVDSLEFIYAKVENKKIITDYHLIDVDRDGILNRIELINVTGIGINLLISYYHKSQKRKVRKTLSIFLRNISSAQTP